MKEFGRRPELYGSGERNRGGPKRWLMTPVAAVAATKAVASDEWRVTRKKNRRALRRFPGNVVQGGTRDGKKGEHTSQNEGRTHDVIENKGEAKWDVGRTHDVDDNK